MASEESTPQPEQSRACTKCSIVKPLSEFYRGNGMFGRQAKCKQCSAAYSREWAKANPESRRRVARQWRERNPDKVKAAWKRNYRKNSPKYRAYEIAKIKRIKAEVFAAYGGFVCQCCGCVGEPFMTLDHINDDGKEHRAIVGNGSRTYKWLHKHGCPAGIVQVLCYNCNFGKKHNGGVCPHKQRKEPAA